MASSRLAVLLFCNVIWASTYAIIKILLDRGYQPMEISFLRTLVAAVPLLGYCAVARKNRKGPTTILGAWLRDLNRVDLRLLAVGALTFFVSPLTQLTGIKLSRAIDGSIMIAIEPLVTVLAACVMLGERFRPRLAVALVLAVVGAGLVSDVTFAKLVASTDTRLLGNAIFAISMLSETAYSTVSKPALSRRSPVLFMMVALWVGLLLILAYNLVLGDPSRWAGLVPLIRSRSWLDWTAILFLGWVATLFGYLYWMLALTKADVSVLALTLYVQPVLGVVFGHYLVGEVVTWSTVAGGALIIVAVWIGVRPGRRALIEPRNP